MVLSRCSTVLRVVVSCFLYTYLCICPYTCNQCGAISRRMIASWGYFITHYMENTRNYHALLKARWRRQTRRAAARFIVFEDEFSRIAMSGESMDDDDGDGRFDDEAPETCLLTMASSSSSLDTMQQSSRNEPSTPPRAGTPQQQKRALLRQGTNGTNPGPGDSGTEHTIATSALPRGIHPDHRDFFCGAIDSDVYTKRRKRRERRCSELAKSNKDGLELSFRGLHDELLVREGGKAPILSVQRIGRSSGAGGKQEVSSTDSRCVNGRLAASRPARSGSTPCHLFVFVHGLLGHATDLRVFRDALASKAFACANDQRHDRHHQRRLASSLMNGGSRSGIASSSGRSQLSSATSSEGEKSWYYLMSDSNQEKTFDSFEVQGKRLATEIREYIGWTFEDNPGIHLERLSFIGHSIGNIVIRSALMQPDLEPYSPLLWSYTSISGPHLGYHFSDNFLLKSGMKVLERLHHSASLSQLAMKEAQAMNDEDNEQAYDPNFLQALARHAGMSWFEHVVLVASQQDRYVPYHSARIEMPPSSSASSRPINAKLEAVRDMIQNIFENMASAAPPTDGSAYRGTDITVVDVSFAGQASGLDIIGRKAHIEFLHNRQYVDTLVWSLNSVFE